MRLSSYWTTKAHEVRYLSALVVVGEVMLEANTIPVRGTARAKLPGDPLAMRGVPICGPMIGSTSPGTQPELALLRRHD